MVFATWFGAKTVLGIPTIFLDDNLGGMIFRSLRNGARADPVLPVFRPSAVPHEADHLFGDKGSVALTALVHMTVIVAGLLCNRQAGSGRRWNGGRSSPSSPVC